MSIKPGKIEVKNEVLIHGHGFVYPYHVRYYKGQYEVQANGFDSRLARLKGEDAIQELLNLEDSGRFKMFDDRKDLIEFLKERL